MVSLEQYDPKPHQLQGPNTFAKLSGFIIYMQDSCLAKDLQKINAINTSLKKLDANMHITLPNITVVGTIFLGKSSTIEQLTGLEYLTGIRTNTRRPLEIHFNHDPQVPYPYAQIDQIIEDGTPKKWLNFKEIPEQLRKLSFQLQIRRQIGTQPIILRIFSKQSPTITVIDTPGYDLLPTLQSRQNISQKIIFHYIQKLPNIILAVLPPTLDHYGRCILPLTRKSDPTQRRTLACLTKIDIMDRGTDAVKMLKNQQLFMRHGFVGIKNRSCQDRDSEDKVSVEEAIQQEATFFKNSRFYSQLPPELLGTASLSKKITTLIYKEIKPQLKEILQYISRQKMNLAVKFQQMNLHICKQGTQIALHLTELISNLQQIHNQIGDIKYKNPNSLMFRDQLSAFLAIQYNTPATEEITDRQMQFDFIKFPGFNQINQFQYTTIATLRKISNKSKQCISQIYDKLKEVTLTFIQQTVGSENIEIKNILVKIALNYLQKNYADLLQFVSKLFESENHLFTNNPDYFSEDYDICKRTGKQNTYIKQFKQRVDNYIRIAVQNLRETVPKQILNFLWCKTIKQLQEQLCKHKQIQVNCHQINKKNLEILQKEEQLLKSLEDIITSDSKMMDIINLQDEIFIPIQPQSAPVIKPQKIQIKRQKIKATQTKKNNFDFSNFFTKSENKDKPQIQKIERPKNQNLTTDEERQRKKKTGFNRLFGI